MPTYSYSFKHDKGEGFGSVEAKNLAEAEKLATKLVKAGKGRKDKLKGLEVVINDPNSQQE